MLDRSTTVFRSSVSSWYVSWCFRFTSTGADTAPANLRSYDSDTSRFGACHSSTKPKQRRPTAGRHGSGAKLPISVNEVAAAIHLTAPRQVTRSYNWYSTVNPSRYLSNGTKWSDGNNGLVICTQRDELSHWGCAYDQPYAPEARTLGPGF